ncbi:hypothetical protein P154DRAFT_614930 [Amniculicola lignicola CBS 123094]|uniref:Metal-dependent phosphohydrolase n=1 Tax=Amniculicola lignicola CBS 123094 TaxID=1392246 RepID=A0A6A5X022_9PLEO|nr:hypothetical protein P154DRAFT_614930 [Amniculicola lignicola CBS 123094]
MDISPHIKFLTMCTAIEIDLDLTTRAIAALESAYRQPPRRYHTLSHIYHMLEDLDKAENLVEEARYNLYFAIWFHDAVYDPTKSGGYNEKQSIIMWEEFVREAAPLLDQYLPSVSCLIRATIQHAIPADISIPANLPVSSIALFLDFDLAILASSSDVYEEYAKGIRQEHLHVPGDTYRKERVKVLTGFLARDKLFLSTDKEAPDKRARLNICGEIEALNDARSEFLMEFD